LFPLLYARFKAAEWRWWLEGIRFGDVRLESNIESAALHGLYWKVIGWYVLLGVAFVVYGGALRATEPEDLARGILVFVMMAVGYLAFVLTLNVVIRLYLVRDIWERVLQSVRVYGLSSVADVATRGELASALGEGFADGLDVAGI
jgi:anti-sigma factor RsiW